MAAIGQLIMCRNIDKTAIMFKAVLTIARSETEGKLANGKETRCEKEKNKLKSIITGEPFLLFSILIFIFIKLVFHRISRIFGHSMY